MLTEAKLSNKKVLVVGCMSEVSEEIILKTFPDASIAGVTSYMHLPDIVKKIESGYRVHRISDRPILPFLPHISRINPLIAYIPISEGCSNACDFCICRIARGSLISYPPEKIVDAVQLAIKNGAKEIVLVGDDVGAYSHNGFSLPSLMRKICTISGDFKIKLGYMNPSSVIKMADDLISALSHPKVYRYIHFNIQSASNTLLRKMKRDYTKKEFMMIVKELRKSYPNLTIETDVIVGYPGESDEDFEVTKMFLRELKPDMINVYPFSKRPHMKLEQEVPSWKIKERYEDMIKIKNMLESESLKKWVGWRGEVCIIDKHNNFLIGRNFAYRDIILKHGSLGEKVNISVSGIHDGYLVA
jgi:MiaB/RimO family radical SAM methylthiotransferase